MCGAIAHPNFYSSLSVKRVKNEPWPMKASVTDSMYPQQ
jgi:hypothetical protein